MHAIDLEAVINSDYPAVIRIAAVKLQRRTYITVGEFLQELCKNDLNELSSFCNAITIKKDSGEMLDSIILLGEMLSQAEGTPLDKPDTQRAANLMILISLESLYRKGLIEFYREKATLGSDFASDIIARLK